MATPRIEPAAEEHHLHRQLGLRDLALAQILSVVGAAWVGTAAALGRAHAVTWMAAMLLFYVPMAATVFNLNRDWRAESISGRERPSGISLGFWSFGMWPGMR